jgi:hypothetical protein
MKRLYFFVLTFIILTAHSSYGQPQVYNEYEIKAAFIYNFSKFVEWPDNVISPSADSITLCIIGNNPFGNMIRAIEGKAVKNKTLSIKNITSPVNIKGCNILFIASSEEDNLKPILSQAAKNHALTIGDTEGFDKMGVIINMFIEEDKVRFNINIDAAERSGFKISSKLLKLSKPVK